MDTQITNLFRKLESLRGKVTQFATEMGCCLEHTNTANRTYFALEYIEQKFMQTFTHYLCKFVHIDSLVYVHDGIYCSPQPNKEQLSKVMHVVTGELKLPYFAIRVIDLLPLWNHSYGHFANQDGQFNKKKRKCENIKQGIVSLQNQTYPSRLQQQKQYLLENKDALFKFFNKKFKAE